LELGPETLATSWRRWPVIGECSTDPQRTGRGELQAEAMGRSSFCLLRKRSTKEQEWWYTPIIPATQDAEAGVF
jgi:hypothetical protein